MANEPRFSKKTIDFLAKAGQQKLTAKGGDWLERNKAEHEAVLIEPLRSLAGYLADHLAKRPEARGYKFPRRGFGRLKRPAHKVGRGDVMYRDWVHLQASRPSPSRFDDNPGLYFFMSPERVFAGGGLYMPSSRQIKRLRAWIDQDPSAMKDLFKTRAFKNEFPGGFETAKSVKTFPRNYPPDHPRIAWLKLQAYYITRPITKRELYSAEFKDLLLANWTQSLRFNEVLYDVLNDKSLDFMPIAPAREEDVSDAEETGGREELWDERL